MYWHTNINMSCVRSCSPAMLGFDTYATRRELAAFVVFLRRRAPCEIFHEHKTKYTLRTAQKKVTCILSRRDLVLTAVRVKSARSAAACQPVLASQNTYRRNETARFPSVPWIKSIPHRPYLFWLVAPNPCVLLHQRKNDQNPGVLS